MINFAKGACALGKIVYRTKNTSTQSTAICEAFCKALENKAAKEKTTTLFDAYCKTISNPEVANRHAARIVGDIEQKSNELKAIADKILKNSGVDAAVSARVKGVDSSASKIIKKFTGFQKKGYESVKENIYDIMFGKGTREVIGDSYGFRYIINSEKTGGRKSSLKLYESILESSQQNSKNFSLTGFEDYYGKGITPYGNKAIRDKFAQLQYQTPSGKTKETVSSFTEKPAGYTRTNINARINCVNVEIQVGGKHTTKWGDVEHILYDMRQNKPLDMSKYTPEQKELALQIQKAYQEVLARKSGHTADEFCEKYLNKLWESFREAEIKNLDTPMYPAFPKGFPEILKVENLLKLAHD